MSVKHEIEQLDIVSRQPPANIADWLLRAETATSFLKTNGNADHIVVYASLPSAHIISVLAPASNMLSGKADDFLKADIEEDESWQIQYISGGREGRRISLARPLGDPGCTFLEGGEPIIIIRRFEGLSTYESQIEINQRILHALDLHFIPERSAYCILDHRGDIRDIITIKTTPGTPTRMREVVVLFDTEYLSKYLALTDQSIYRKFDFTRVLPGSFVGWDNIKRSAERSPDLFYNGGVCNGQGSFINGGQILRTKRTVQDLLDEWHETEAQENKKYATFKIQDWKNKKLVEVAAGPDTLADYFMDSKRPFTTSPAFFRPEVLLRFKADLEKYRLEDRSITCRNAWHLKEYDVNEEGQVHAYIGDLARLPYEEQLYWSTFNEWPKAPISQRSFINDFEGDFAESDSLQSLRQNITSLDAAETKWWTPRGREAIEKLLYPSTDSTKEWADEILTMDQIVVEGFNSKQLKKMAQECKADFKPEWGSIKLIEAILIATGTSQSDAAEVIQPLTYLHTLRSKLKGHLAPSERTKLEKAALTKHKSFRSQIDSLADDCNNSMTIIRKALSSL